MTTIFITIGLALLAICILIYSYLETQEERELNAMYQRRWLCEERALKAEKAFAVNALKRIAELRTDDKELCDIVSYTTREISISEISSGRR